jgi:hypothetical protein
VQFLGLRIPHDREQVAADAVAGRFHQPECCVGGDRRVDGAAAVAHHLQRDLRRQRVRGRGNRVRGVDLAAGGEGGAGDAVSGGGEKAGRDERHAEKRFPPFVNGARQAWAPQGQWHGDSRVMASK